MPSWFRVAQKEGGAESKALIEMAYEARIFDFPDPTVAEPFSGFRLNGQGTYTLSEFTDYVSFDPIDSINAFNCRQQEAGITIAMPAECVRVPFNGNNLSRAPKLSVTVGVEYYFFLEAFGTFTPRFQYYWQSDTWYRAFNRTPENSGPNCGAIGLPSGPNDALCGNSIVNDLQGSYLTADAKLTWKSPTARYWFEAAVQNLTDERAYQKS